MKNLVILSSLFISIVASAEKTSIRCEVEYKKAENHSQKIVGIYDVGTFSVQDCIRAALQAKNESINPVSFKYVHITKNANTGSDADNEGWSVSGVVTDANMIPSKLEYKELTKSAAAATGYYQQAQQGYAQQGYYSCATGQVMTQQYGCQPQAYYCGQAPAGQGYAFINNICVLGTLGSGYNNGYPNGGYPNYPQQQCPTGFVMSQYGCVPQQQK